MSFIIKKTAAEIERVAHDLALMYLEKTFDFKQSDAPRKLAEDYLRILIEFAVPIELDNRTRGNSK